MKAPCNKISISPGNQKMGYIPSVSLPPVVTCANGCKCASKCYAARLCKIRKTVREAYERNLQILNTDPAAYWLQVKAAAMVTKYFRFHVSGDIVDNAYFQHMVEIARTNPHCEILCFTKKYDIVNSHISIIGKLPQNLHIVFSGWPGLEMDNPYLVAGVDVLKNL